MKLSMFLLISIAFLMTSSVARASSIDSFQPNNIVIINQTGNDVGINWKFTEINDTHWLVNFAIPFQSAIKDYPLVSLSDNLVLSKSSIDQTKENSFYIIFPKGFQEGLSARFGTGTTIINTTTTTPFNSYQRAICRDDNNIIHVAWSANATTVSYANSTDGLKFNTININTTNTETKGTPSISCSGRNIAIFYSLGSSSRLAVHVSSDNGGTWSYKNPIASVGVPSGETRGNNIYVVFTDTANSIKYINSSDYGLTYGSIKTLFAGQSAVFPSCTQIGYSQPTMTISGTGSANDKIFIAVYNQTDIYDVDVVRHRCLSTSTTTYAVSFINSTDSGTTFGQQKLVNSNPTLQLYSPSITYNQSDDTRIFIAMEGILASGAQNAIYFSNSTNSGLTWTTPYQINASSKLKGTPTVTVNNTNPTVFWSEQYGTSNLNNYVVYRNLTTGWNAQLNLTTGMDSVFPNSKFNTSGNCIELVWLNRTNSTTCSITSPCHIYYQNISPCSPYIPPVTPPPVTPSAYQQQTLIIFYDNGLKEIYNIQNNFIFNNEKRYIASGLTNDTTIICRYKQDKLCLNLNSGNAIYLYGYNEKPDDFITMLADWFKHLLGFG